MPGAYYCNGEMEECKDSSKCYKNGGTCYHTNDSNYIAKEKPVDAIRKVWGDQLKHGHNGFTQYRKDKYEIFSDWIFPAAVSVIVSFVTTLITILAIML